MEVEFGVNKYSENNNKVLLTFASTAILVSGPSRTHGNNILPVSESRDLG
jgi:hypothetical protein